MKPHVTIECHTRENRLQAIQHSETMLNEFGFIEDFNMLSDIALNIIASIEVKKIKPLIDDIHLQRVIHIDNTIGMEDIEQLEEDKEIMLYFDLTFVENKGIEH